MCTGCLVSPDRPPDGVTGWHPMFGFEIYFDVAQQAEPRLTVQAGQGRIMGRSDHGLITCLITYSLDCSAACNELTDHQSDGLAFCPEVVVVLTFAKLTFFPALSLW